MCKEITLLAVLFLGPTWEKLFFFFLRKTFNFACEQNISLTLPSLIFGYSVCSLLTLIQLDIGWGKGWARHSCVTVLFCSNVSVLHVSSQVHNSKVVMKASPAEPFWKGSALDTLVTPENKAVFFKRLKCLNTYTFIPSPSQRPRWRWGWVSGMSYLPCYSLGGTGTSMPVHVVLVTHSSWMNAGHGDDFHWRT